MENRLITGRSGTRAAIIKKHSAIFLLPLSVWFIYMAHCLIKSDVSDVHSILISPINISLAIFFVLSAIVNFSHDFAEMMQDYISCYKTRLGVMLVFYFIVGFALILFLLSIIYLHILVRITTLM